MGRTAGLIGPELVYGLERLETQRATAPGQRTTTWHLNDALGSVRTTLDDSSAALASMRYDPWGQPQTGAIAPFGFTGEFQDGSIVYLRARWYHAGQGTLLGRDPFAGFPDTPYSLHPYAYAYSDPVRLTDPTGRCATWILGDPTCRPIWETGGGPNWEAGGHVVVAGGGVAATIVGCAATALVGCVVLGAGAAGVSSWGHHALDNAGDPSLLQATTDVDWAAIGRDTILSVPGNLTAGIAGRGLAMLCSTGKACSALYSTATGSISGGIEQIVANITDCRPETQAGDGVVSAMLVDGFLGAGLGSLLVRMPVIKPYGDYFTKINGKRKSTLTDKWEAHHINQNAAFDHTILKDDGLAVPVNGSTNKKTTMHHKFHKYMENKFWDTYRAAGDPPTYYAYTQAVYRAARASGFNEVQARALQGAALRQQISYKLYPWQQLPGIPNRVAGIPKK